MGKRKKACTQPPRWGRIHAYVPVCGHKKKSGYRPPDFSDSDTRSMKPCFIVPVGVLPSLRRPALLLSSVLGQKTELTSQSPVFSGLSEFSSKITQSSFTITQLALCDLSLPDGTGLEFLHTIRDVSDKFKVKNPPLKLLPFFVLTENNDLMTEYQYRYEGVNDYFVSPINIPELIRRILFFID
ncbi:response regulator [Neglecta sp. X4]|uniref:response regulator n=1 Tax=unclassified Neglectibacter TaxID=2632164 RepID=UPI0013701B63|nr:MULTISPECIES: response regulator [unclassified Neglectibacter]NBI19099.1 response regulator [Neglectibacter sp. 59]NBJ74770.1 response regulator [Neglectibacter sp. X4]NCE82616.1 response regulator [Neglectibacter sp. X58]